jgi:hypothetical protein
VPASWSPDHICPSVGREKTVPGHSRSQSILDCRREQSPHLPILALLGRVLGRWQNQTAEHLWGAKMMFQRGGRRDF